MSQKSSFPHPTESVQLLTSNTLALQAPPISPTPMTSHLASTRQSCDHEQPRSLNTSRRTTMNEWPPPGRTIIGAAYAGPGLVTDNVRLFEWESFPRREPRKARERLGPLNPTARLPKP